MMHFILNYDRGKDKDVEIFLTIKLELIQNMPFFKPAL